MESTMTEERNVGGRPRRAIPRKPKRVMMSDTTMREVRHWQDCRKREDKEVGFSDAVGDMIKHAAVFGVDKREAYRIVPISQVLGNLWMRRKYAWLRVDPNTGRTLHCVRCGATEEVETVRFSGIIRAINRFFKQHRACKAKAT